MQKIKKAPREDVRKKRNDLKSIRQRKKPGKGSADVVGFRFTNVDPNKVSVRLQNHLQWTKESCSTKSKSVAKRLVNDYGATLI